MKIKAGTPCYISKQNSGNKIYPILGEFGRSYFSVEQEIEIKKDLSCENKNLVAVLTKASAIKHLIAPEEIETIVWIDKRCL